eukprot:TRINITY_DN5498_c2_g1_i1.p4 TRINITY_DN5498_c2_g1~~TRINITY_DN5498_c2_g1_i1.p4  ORF type:complete len:133 (-),score=1.75 TRINITY_DN5498_c2_g1_i1:439-837(-)
MKIEITQMAIWVFQKDFFGIENNRNNKFLVKFIYVKKPVKIQYPFFNKIYLQTGLSYFSLSFSLFFLVGQFVSGRVDLKFYGCSLFFKGKLNNFFFSPGLLSITFCARFCVNLQVYVVVQFITSLCGYIFYV